jgi:hypothetical protein
VGLNNDAKHNTQKALRGSAIATPSSTSWDDIAGNAGGAKVWKRKEQLPNFISLKVCDVFMFIFMLRFVLSSPYCIGGFKACSRVASNKN